MFKDLLETDGNYFDGFNKIDNDERVYDHFRPLPREEKLYRVFDRVDPRLKDDALEKGICLFQRIIRRCGIVPGIGDVRLERLDYEEKTMKGYPDETLIVKHRPSGKHKKRNNPGDPIIDIDWDYIKSDNAQDAAWKLVIVLLHEYMHEKMSTEKNVFNANDAFFIQKEEAMANALTLKALEQYEDDDDDEDKELLEYANQQMKKQPQELGYRYGIEIYGRSKDKTIETLAEEWKNQKRGITPTFKEEKEAFFREVMKGL